MRRGRHGLGLIAAVVVSCCGCGGPQRDAAPPPPPPDAAVVPSFDQETARELADGFLEVLGTMAQIVEQRGPDCSAMADDLEALFDRSEPMFELARSAAEDGESMRLLNQEMARHDAAVTPLVERISPGLEGCRSEPRLVEIMGRMPVL